MAWNIAIHFGDLRIEHVLFDLNGTSPAKGRSRPRRSGGSLGAGGSGCDVRQHGPWSPNAPVCAADSPGEGAGQPVARNPRRRPDGRDGQQANDMEMLRAAALGMAILGRKGGARALAAAVWFGDRRRAGFASEPATSGGAARISLAPAGLPRVGLANGCCLFKSVTISKSCRKHDVAFVVQSLN